MAKSFDWRILQYMFNKKRDIICIFISAIFFGMDIILATGLKKISSSGEKLIIVSNLNEKIGWISLLLVVVSVCGILLSKRWILKQIVNKKTGIIFQVSSWVYLIVNLIMWFLLIATKPLP